MNNEFHEFVTAVGALAEALRMFNSALLKNGFSRSEALELTHTYLRETISNANNNENKEDF